MDWKIYYGDGSTFSNEDGEPYEAPPHNVIAIAQENKSTGRDVFHSWDWYFYHDDFRWWGVGTLGLIDQIMHDIERIHGVLQGRSIKTETFNEILARARTEPGLSPKSAKRKGEYPAQKYGLGKDY